VEQRLEAAGRTLMALPLPKGALPASVKSRWPEAVHGIEDAFAALVGSAEQVKEDFAAERNRTRISPSAREVAQMDEALQWLWYLRDPKKRRLCIARALIHPISERHIVSYRKLGRLFGLHHDTIRIWHDRALSEIAQALTRDKGVKKHRRKRRTLHRR
jgi:hypothetical protein